MLGPRGTTFVAQVSHPCPPGPLKPITAACRPALRPPQPAEIQEGRSGATSRVAGTGFHQPPALYCPSARYYSPSQRLLKFRIERSTGQEDGQLDA
jgi:hypothetical protein